MSSFQYCLIQGKKYEKETLKYVQYDTFEFSEGYCKEWDLEITKDDVKTIFEVKSERYAGHSGNICVEYSYNGKPSGVRTTIANMWVHYAIMKDGSHICYFIPIEDLKKLIAEKKYIKNILSGGDGKKSSFYIFRMIDLERWIKMNYK